MSFTNASTLHRAPRMAARLLAALLVLAPGVRAAAAQDAGFDPRAPDTGIVVHWMTVTTPAARFTFERVTGRAVVLSVRTDSGTFDAVRDSATMAALADSVAAAPAPAAAAGNEKVSFKYWELPILGDSGAHMRFARVPTKDGAEVIVAVSNGAWGIVVHPGPQTATVLAGFRGDTVTTGDAAYVSYRTSRVWPRPNQCGAEDSARVATTPVMGPTCGHVAKHSSRLSAGPPTIYPPDLLRAHISGSVLLTFEVDTTGRADMSSVVLHKRSPEPGFARACRDRVRQMTFSPAEIDGRKVAEVIGLPCDFVIRRETAGPAGSGTATCRLPLTAVGLCCILARESSRRVRTGSKGAMQSAEFTTIGVPGDATVAVRRMGVDRFIVATARRRGAILATCDQVILDYADDGYVTVYDARR